MKTLAKQTSVAVFLACCALAGRQAPTTQPAPGASCFARHVPERKDDIAWENDRVAFRIYGPALEHDVKEHNSSGIDLWGKRTRDSIINTWYAAGDYHHDHGTGLDFYEVGTSRGCGGLGIWANGTLQCSEDWVSHQILDLGPDKCGFTVTYAPWQIRTGNNSRKVWEKRTITLAKGSNLNRIESTLSSDTKEDLIVGIGIAKRPFVGGGAKTVAAPGALGRLLIDTTKGLMSYWQPEEAPGSMAVGVVVDPASVVGIQEDAENQLLLIRVKPGQPFVYYQGGCWSKGLDFHTPQEWETYLSDFKPEFKRE